jgi:hypothetical protein
MVSGVITMCHAALHLMGRFAGLGSPMRALDFSVQVQFNPYCSNSIYVCALVDRYKPMLVMERTKGFADGAADLSLQRS